MRFVVLLIGHGDCFHIYVFRNWCGRIYCKMNRNQPQQHGLADHRHWNLCSEIPEQAQCKY